MATKNTNDSVLNTEEVDELLVLCEEVMRATPDGTNRFIEPAPGVLSRAKAKQHSMVFGRRGSGKSSLLRKTAADLTVDSRPIAFVDLETFKGHTYPDVLISVLIKTLSEFERWLNGAAINPATKTSFWKRFFGTTPKRPPFNKVKTADLKNQLIKIISDLETQLSTPETSNKQVKTTTAIERTSSIQGQSSASIPALATSVTGNIGGKTNIANEEQSTYVSHKVEYLHQNILRFQKFFKEMSELSDGPSFLILDDLYHIRNADQAKVIDYFHRIAKGNGMWVKIGTIKHRSQWYEHSDPPIGMKLGDDAKEINLDISLEKFETLKAFLRQVLGNLVLEKPPLSIKS